MGLKLSTAKENEALPIGVFRPTIVTITCDMGSLFCPTFTAETTPATGYDKIHRDAIRAGWHESRNRWVCPNCSRLR